MNYLKIIVIILLLIGLPDLPYGYYQVLRWIVTGVTGYLAYLAYENEKKIWVWIFGVIAILFNPIIPFYLDKSTWVLIDVVVAGLILVSLFQKTGTRR